MVASPEEPICALSSTREMSWMKCGQPGNFLVDVVSKSFPCTCDGYSERLLSSLKAHTQHVYVRKESERLFIQMSKNLSYMLKVNEFTDLDNQ